MKYCLCCAGIIALGIVFSFAFHSYGQLSTAKITVTQGRLDTICGTHNVKLVFTCRDSLYFVDFSEQEPRIRQMANLTKAFFPVISSDGKWITYQTDAEVEGPSTDPVSGKIWFRELAIDGTPVKITDTGYVPRFVQNIPFDTQAIVYSTSVECPQQECYASGRTVKCAIVNKIPQNLETVLDGGSYYGGISWDNRYLATGWPGGKNVFMLDLNNAGTAPCAVHSMHVKKNGTEADTFVSIGACNISRSASRIFTDVMMYYDFGSGAVTSAGCHHPLLGTWKEHSLLFISRHDAEDLKVFAMPAERGIVPSADAQGLGEAVAKEWYYPEWSNHPYYAAACLNIDRLWLKNGNWEHKYSNESIYMVGLKDSQYVNIIESTDTSFTSATNFKYPFIWVEIPEEFKENSSWLSTTIWDRIDAISQFRDQEDNNTTRLILTDPRITEISLFNLSGRKITSIKTGITIEKIKNTAGTGIFFIKTSIGGKEQKIIRFVNTR
jgi:hypothetical protein